MANGGTAALSGWSGGKGRSGANIARREAVQAVWCAGEKGITRESLAVRLGILQSEAAALVSGVRFVTEQYEVGRGIVYYWSGPRKAEPEEE